MKKTMLFSSALVALAMLASCQKEEFIETPATATGVTEFTATIESTKTTIATDGKVTWTAGDEITVTDAAEPANTAIYVAQASGASTTFSLKSGEAVTTAPYTATYGDYLNQVYSPTGANCPLEATTADAGSTTLHFSSPYAVLKITAKSSGEETIKTVVVKYGNSSSVLDCEGQNVTLTSDGVAFYVAVQPSTEAAALSVTFYNTANKMAKKTRNGSILLDAKDLLPVTLGSFEWTDLKTFKAMYKETDGSLTFFYDTQNHSGEGITVYENGTDKVLFDDTKYYFAKWGYNGNRSKIKSVVIDGSVKDYPFLKNTAYMFYGMINADSISGEEHLDVSGVNDMTAMFYNFGSASLNYFPNVSSWNTENVVYMNNMFQLYGSRNTKFNAVPDVSGWNTGAVKNMSNMFKSFASNSEELEWAPKVNGTNWDTDEVNNLNAMFCYYGTASKKLKEAPDVSNWETKHVTNMGDLFLGYGHNSGELKAAPEVDNWDTGSVTTVTNLFQDYGNGSASFNLDLSNWDLSEIESDGNVFKCAPAAFNVKIPAKTDGKSNDTGNWYYGQGGNGGSITPPTNKEFEFTLATN